MEPGSPGLERVVERGMYADHAVDSGELEQADDAGIRGDDAQRMAALAESSSRTHERSDARGVEERAPREIHHHLAVDPGQGLLDPGGGREIELAGDVDHVHTPRQPLAVDGKLLRGGHDGRV